MSDVEMPIEDLYGVYYFKDPRNQKFVYIGITIDIDRRYKEHVSKRGLLYPLVQELAKEGLQVMFDIFETIPGTKNAFKLEREYIRKYQPELNSIHNAAAVRAKREIIQYREEIASTMYLYNFTFDEALIWHNQFSATAAGDNWYTYQTIRDTAIVVAKRLQGDANFTESEILDIALEATRFYEKWGSMWEPFMKSLRIKGGMEGE